MDISDYDTETTNPRPLLGDQDQIRELIPDYTGTFKDVVKDKYSDRGPRMGRPSAALDHIAIAVDLKNLHGKYGRDELLRAIEWEAYYQLLGGGNGL